MFQSSWEQLNMRDIVARINIHKYVVWDYFVLFLILILHPKLQSYFSEAPESVMCDVIKIRLKRRIATRSGKENQPLDIKTAVEWPIFNLGLPNFRWSFYSILLLVASLL